MTFDLEFVQVLWFFLLGILLTGYAILDGFDLGVGILHFVARTDTDRRLFMNSIGPLWDGNEVWLVTFGGALFAAFPDVYASAFSGFYMPFMLLLFALIFRAVSMEFRSKFNFKAWRACWDVAFCAASAAAAFLFGVAVGNIMIGLPIDETRSFSAPLLSLLTPYPILCGLFVVSMFALHGSIYLYLKLEGELQERVHTWIWRAFGVFLVLFLFLTMYTLQAVPRATYNFTHYPWAWIVVGLNVLAIANIPRAVFHGRPVYAFVSSCCTIAAFNFLFAVALFPNLLVSNIDPEYHLTVFNASSSEKTLWLMTLFAVIGIPFVLAYTAVIYWTFRGKVELGKFSY
ncbi:MAG: cytochrome c oxidase assembly protein [Candidatus Hydrogenedentota bacterium]